MPNSLHDVLAAAYKSDPFLKSLLADPDAALKKARLTLTPRDLQTLKSSLKAGYKTDIPGAIAAAHAQASAGFDPWPRLWPEYGSGGR